MPIAPRLMAASIIKPSPEDATSNAVDRAGSTQSATRQHLQNIDLTVEGTRWFGQRLTPAPSRSERKTHPQTTPAAVANKVIEVALSNPIWGCCKLAVELRQHGILLSSPTVQKILIKHRMGSQRERATQVLEHTEQGHAISLHQSMQVKRILRLKD